MNFLKLLPVCLLAALLMVTTACGPSRKEKQLTELSDAQKAMLDKAREENREVLAAAQSALNKNQESKAKLAQAQEDIVRSNAELERVITRIIELEKQLDAQTKAIEEQKKANEAKSGGWLWIILILIVIGLGVFFIWRLYSGRSEMEEDEDEYADYDDDGDLGLDDDNFGDDLSDEPGTNKKDGKPGDDL